MEFNIDYQTLELRHFPWHFCVWSVCAIRAVYCVGRFLTGGWYNYLQLDWPSETDTHKLICREAERATTDPRPRMKSSCRGASIGMVTKAPFLFFGELILKIDEKYPNKLRSLHHWIRPMETLVLKSQVLLRCLGLIAKLWFVPQLPRSVAV